MRHTKTAIYIPTTFERPLERTAERLAMSRLTLLKFRQVIKTCFTNNASKTRTLRLQRLVSYAMRLRPVLLFASQSITKKKKRTKKKKKKENTAVCDEEEDGEEKRRIIKMY